MTDLKTLRADDDPGVNITEQSLTAEDRAAMYPTTPHATAADAPQTRECPGTPITPGIPDDGLHCEDWYDGERCCRCGAPALAADAPYDSGDAAPLSAAPAQTAAAGPADTGQGDGQDRQRRALRRLVDAADAWREWYAQSAIRMQEPSNAECDLIAAIDAIMDTLPYCELCSRMILPGEPSVPPLPGVGLHEHVTCPPKAGEGRTDV